MHGARTGQKGFTGQHAAVKAIKILCDYWGIDGLMIRAATPAALPEADRKDGSPLVVGLDSAARRPVEASPADRPLSAIEEALGQKGLVLLPQGQLRLTPAAGWVHKGLREGRSDTYIGSVTTELGLPAGMALSVRQPYVWRDTSYGSNQGRGDTSIALARKLSEETDSQPSFVAQLSYTHDNGLDPFAPVGLGSGFRSFEIGVSALKRWEPVAFYGTSSYGRAKSLNATLREDEGAPYFTGRIDPGDTYRLGFGVSLAATPEVALDVGMSMVRVQRTRYTDAASGEVSFSDRQTIGILNLGTRTLLSRNLSMSVSAAAGLTRNAPDFSLTVALPYRF